LEPDEDTIPLRLAAAYRAIGDFAAAEDRYRQVNATPSVRQQLAGLYLDWGDALFRLGEIADAKDRYARAIGPDGIAQTVLTGLDRYFDNPSEACIQDNVDASIAEVVLEIHARLTKIGAGLDFFGQPSETVPTLNFDQLRSVATRLARQAAIAEQDVVGFWNQADSGRLTRVELSRFAAQANAEVEVLRERLEASERQLEAYQRGQALAEERAEAVDHHASDYADMSSAALMYQALSIRLNDLSDSLTAEVVTKQSQACEIATMVRTANELHLAAAQAAAEVSATQAQVTAQKASVAAARLRAAAARELLRDTTFTADVWNAVGDSMHSLHHRHLTVALGAARLAQRAYNFENDTDLRRIRLDCGATTLLADLGSFTSEPQLASHDLSLADLCGYEFETRFRRTGVLEFETTAEEFDQAFPGAFGGRLQAVDVEVLGIDLSRALTATLTDLGVSAYRSPGSGLRFHLHPPETRLLWDSPMSGTFQNAGIASSWRLELPKAVNNIDFDTITDIRLTFHYFTRFDSGLRAHVLPRIEALPGIHERQLGISLRRLYPETFAALKEDKTTVLSLRRQDLPAGHQQPVLDSVDVVVATETTLTRANLGVTVGTPGKTGRLAVTNGNGIASSESLGSPWAELTGGSALGEFTLRVSEADGTPIDLGGLADLGLILNYSFTTES
jgi:tetratricopeptide (TPR) repeat protein